jgi:nicotinate-nucleotide--dimethylbenzimidazole phosphoribosyltransferase
MSILDDTIAQITALDAAAMAAAGARQAQLTKPAGSLGRLEELAVQIAGITGQPRPSIQQPVVIVMAADHGVARQRVSAYSAEVTPQMVANFLHGGAAINVLARHVGVQIRIVDMGVGSAIAPHPALIDRKIAFGTHDFSIEPAMTRAQALQALESGIALAIDTIANGADLLATGDMGIGNSTPSSAIVAAITGQPVASVTGRGTGVDDAGLARKIAVIEAALALHTPRSTDALDVLAKVGGFEIGGLAGVMLGAAAKRVPVVIDGFISGAAALIATTLAPALRHYLIAGHRSVERGHAAVFAQLDLEPLLDLGMRLGEGTGAVLAQSLCVVACKTLHEMATFGEAGVSTQ